MISDDFASVALILPMAQVSHMTPNSCAKNCNLTSKSRGFLSAEGSCEGNTPEAENEGFQKESPNFRGPFLEVPC